MYFSILTDIILIFKKEQLEKRFFFIKMTLMIILKVSPEKFKVTTLRLQLKALTTSMCFQVKYLPLCEIILLPLFLFVINTLNRSSIYYCEKNRMCLYLNLVFWKIRLLSFAGFWWPYILLIYFDKYIVTFFFLSIA